MNTPNMSLVPLQLASLCLDCEMITPAQAKCMACGSVAVLNIARTLNSRRAISSKIEAAPITHVGAMRSAHYGDFLHST